MRILMGLFATFGFGLMIGLAIGRGSVIHKTELFTCNGPDGKPFICGAASN